MSEEADCLNKVLLVAINDITMAVSLAQGWGFGDLGYWAEDGDNDRTSLFLKMETTSVKLKENYVQEGLLEAMRWKKMPLKLQVQPEVERKWVTLMMQEVKLVCSKQVSLGLWHLENLNRPLIGVDGFVTAREFCT